MSERHMQVFLSTTDPENGLPALTTLLYRVCNGEQAKFEEANRLIELFIDEALKNKSK